MSGDKQSTSKPTTEYDHSNHILFKKCDKGKVKNPESNRCVLVTGEKGKLIIKALDRIKSGKPFPAKGLGKGGVKKSELERMCDVIKAYK